MQLKFANLSPPDEEATTILLSRAEKSAGKVNQDMTRTANRLKQMKANTRPKIKYIDATNIYVANLKDLKATGGEFSDHKFLTVASKFLVSQRAPMMSHCNNPSTESAP